MAKKEKKSVSMTSPMYVSGKTVGQVSGPTGGKDNPDPMGVKK